MIFFVEAGSIKLINRTLALSHLTHNDGCAEVFSEASRRFLDASSKTSTCGLLPLNLSNSKCRPCRNDGFEL